MDNPELSDAVAQALPEADEMTALLVANLAAAINGLSGASAFCVLGEYWPGDINPADVLTVAAAPDREALTLRLDLRLI